MSQLKSTKVPKEMIEKIIEDISSLPNVTFLETTSKYELFRGTINNSLIIIYKSGSITYKDSETISTVLNKYQTMPIKRELKKTSGYKEINVKISTVFLDELLKNMKEVSEKIKTKADHEIARFQIEGNNITIYKTGSVYSPKGHPRFEEAILKTLKEDKITKEYNIIIGQDETGKGELFGPMVTASIALTRDLCYEFQMSGIKDSKDLSKERIEEYARKIKKKAIAKRAVKIKPERFNKLFEQFKEEKKTLNDLLAWSHSKALEEVLSQMDKSQIEKEKILVIIDEFSRIKTDQRISSILKKYPMLEVVQTPKAENESVAVAAASILAKDVRNTELKKLETEIGIRLQRQKIGSILMHPKGATIVKYPYLETEIANGLILKIKQMEGIEANDILKKRKKCLEEDLLDFKREFPKNASDISKIISAFANTNGGEIFFGITDDNRELIGIDNPQNYEERIAGLNRKLDPFPKIWVTKITDTAGKKFLRVTVEKSSVPVSSDKKYYKRIGSTCENMTTDEVLSYREKI